MNESAWCKLGEETGPHRGDVETISKMSERDDSQWVSPRTLMTMKAKESGGRKGFTSYNELIHPICLLINGCFKDASWRKSKCSILKMPIRLITRRSRSLFHLSSFLLLGVCRSSLEDQRERQATIQENIPADSSLPYVWHSWNLCSLSWNLWTMHNNLRLARGNLFH